MHQVVVTGAQGGVGRRVLDRLAAVDRVQRVVAVDLAAGPAPGSAPYTYEAVQADLAVDDLAPILEGADTVLHLAFTPQVVPDDEEGARRNVVAARRLFDAAAAAGVGTVVVVSSATVYGAWPDNPVPLTEDAPLRPNPGFLFAAQKVEIERLANAYRDAHHDTAVAVLRPAPAVAEDGAGWLAQMLRAAALIGIDADQPPRQFLHFDDLAAAVVLAARDRLDGAFNVAPDGWIAGDQVRALAGVPPRLPIPERVVNRINTITRELGLVQAPAGLDSYLRHPWVVANDRLRAAGWRAHVSNEQAFVGSHEGSAWAEMSPKRRQELALGVAAAALVAVTAAGVAVLRRRRRV